MDPNADTDPTRRRRHRRRWLLLVAVCALAVVAYPVVLIAKQGPPAADDVGLVQIFAEIERGNVTSAVVDDGAHTVTVTLADGRDVQSAYTASGADTIIDRLARAGITDTEIVGDNSSSRSFRLLLTFGPVLLILGVLAFAVRKAGPTGQLAGFTSKHEPVRSTAVRFSDVIGVDEAVSDLDDIVAYLKEPARFLDVGARAPKGALLVGPPGTGKTLLGKAVANEAGVPFFYVNGADFVEIFAGSGQRRVKALFRAARKHDRAVVFIDEIDAVGKARSNGARSGAADEQENTLNALLTELDGFADSNVIVLAATNRPDILDPALTRAGRFDRRVHVPLPDRGGRTRMFGYYLRDTPLADGVDIDALAERLARRSIGMAGADVANILNEAKLLAARAGAREVTAEMLERALEREAMGRERPSAVMTDHERRIVAYHEAGHTVCAMTLPLIDDPMHVSIVPRGAAGGVTWLDPGESEHFITRSKMIASLAVMMGGRAAEKVILDGDYTQGASSDLDAATKRATQMVCQFGMSDLGPVTIDSSQLIGEDAIRVRGVITALIEDAAQRADELVGEHWPLVDAVAQALLDREDLTREQLRDIADRLGTV